MKKMIRGVSSQNQIILLSSIIHPTNELYDRLNNQIALVNDWESMVSSIIERGVGPLFYSKLPQLSNRTLISAGNREKLKQAYFITLSRGMMLYNIFAKAADLLKNNQVDFIVLKGTYLAEKLYGDIALRQFSDIDLLIREEDGEKARQVLKDAGFQSDDYPMAEFLRQHVGFEHYPQLVFQGVSVELHVRLNRPGEQFQIVTDSVWQHAEMVSLQGIEVKVPDLYDLLIHTCVHLHKHFRDGQVQFTGFNDIVNLLVIHADTINADELEARCKEYRCEEIVFKYLLLASRYYQINLPTHIVDKYGDYLNPGDEEQFLSYLSGKRSKHYSVASRMKGIKQVKGIGMKLKFLFLMMFPTKKYMIASYKIKTPSLYWCYYPYRYWVGLKGVWKIVF